MMEAIKSCPKVLLHRLLLTPLVGAGCLAVGIAYYCFSRDMVFLLLSGAVFAASTVQFVRLCLLIKKKKYRMTEGVCVGVTPKPLRRYRKVRLMDEAGLETTLLLDKRTQIKIGYRYRAFFKEEAQPSLGSEYLDTALSGSNFLGMEELGKYTFPQKSLD